MSNQKTRKNSKLFILTTIGFLLIFALGVLFYMGKGVNNIEKQKVYSAIIQPIYTPIGEIKIKPKEDYQTFKKEGDMYKIGEVDILLKNGLVGNCKNLLIGKPKSKPNKSFHLTVKQCSLSSKAKEILLGEGNPNSIAVKDEMDKIYSLLFPVDLDIDVDAQNSDASINLFISSPALSANFNFKYQIIKAKDKYILAIKQPYMIPASIEKRESNVSDSSLLYIDGFKGNQYTYIPEVKLSIRNKKIWDALYLVYKINAKLTLNKVNKISLADLNKILFNQPVDKVLSLEETKKAILQNAKQVEESSALKGEDLKFFKSLVKCLTSENSLFTFTATSDKDTPFIYEDYNFLSTKQGFNAHEYYKNIFNYSTECYEEKNDRMESSK
jgi:uncharacterized protein (UPF0335 family)